MVLSVKVMYVMNYKLTYIIQGGEEMNKTQVSELRTKNQVTEAIRNGLSIITLDSGYISEEMLDKHIDDSNKYSPTWYDVLASLLFNDTENYDLPRIKWDDLDLYIYRLIRDGYVLFTAGADGVVTIHDAEGDLVDWSDIIDTIGNNIEIYIPQPGLLSYVYDRFIKLEDVLSDLDIHIHDLPLLMDGIIDDVDYRFVHDLVVYR